MKNRSTLLLAILAANDRLGQSEVHRTVLMKQAFLAETIRPLYRLWLRTFSFVRYYYGPYSDDLFCRLDALIFNGLVEVTAFHRSSGRVEARYRITSGGQSILRALDAPEIRGLADDLVWALQAIGVGQAASISRLAYQEAEFARILSSQSASGMGAEQKVPLPDVMAANNETLTTLASLRALSSRGLNANGEFSELTLPPREIVRIFLEYLSTKIPRQRETPA